MKYSHKNLSYIYPLAALLLIVPHLLIQAATVPPSTRPPGYTIPIIDLAHETHRQVIVDRQPSQYLGHPTTVLLDDGKTILAVYPKGHGSGAIVLKCSNDGGLTWSKRLPTPDNWTTSREVPTIYKLTDRHGRTRLILFSGLYPIRMSLSEDNGRTWTPLKPIGNFGGIVAMASLTRLKDGTHIAFFHDDGRYIRGGPYTDRRGSPCARTTGRWTIYKTLSSDGGLTWSDPIPIATSTHAHICEPGLIRSPDGRQIALLLRENSRKYNSFVIFSNDEGKTWTKPKELPAALTGDRHVASYTPDGRLLVTFRDTTRHSPTKGDWVAWVGTYDDIRNGRQGQYRIRLMDNTKAADCGYPALERLPDGTFVATSYGHWTKGQMPYIVSVRFKIEELDKKFAALAPKQTDLFISGTEGYHTFRIPALLVTKTGTLLAFCEARKTSPADHGDIDLVLKRSTDAGRTWSSLQLVYEQGGTDPITIGNPCPVLDRQTGRIWLLFCRNNTDVLATFSDADGLHWSEPRLITRSVKKPTWSWYATGPGIGIQLQTGPHKGRLIIPCDHREIYNGRPTKFSHVIYSDDHGKTWKLGGSVAPHTDECQLVELPDGRLLINMRNYWAVDGHQPDKAFMRAVAYSNDGGLTWTDLQFHPTLIEPVCQASFIRYSWPGPGSKGRLLFSNPADGTHRRALTVRLSYDQGRTWPIARLLHAGPAAYSSLAVLPNGDIACLYEAGRKHPYQKIRFARWPLTWLTSGTEKAM